MGLLAKREDWIHKLKELFMNDHEMEYVSERYDKCVYCCGESRWVRVIIKEKRDYETSHAQCRKCAESHVLGMLII